MFVNVGQTKVRAFNTAENIPATAGSTSKGLSVGRDIGGHAPWAVVCFFADVTRRLEPNTFGDF